MTESDIQRAFQKVPGLFLIIAPDERFTIIGASDDYLFATHSSASIIGRPLFEVFHGNPDGTGGEGPQLLQASLRRVIASGATDTMPPLRYDLRTPGAPGTAFEERYWAPVNAPILDADGRVQYIVHRVEDATARANRDATTILESITEGFFTLDRNWRFDFVNREAHRILAREPGSLAGKVLWREFPGLEGTEFEACYHRAMFQREKSSFTGYYTQHGAWYEVTCYPVTEGVSVFFRDVTKQRLIQAERERLAIESDNQRRIYETALDSTPDFFYVFDLDHRAIYANEALLKVWGVSDVRGKKWTELGYEQWHADLHDSEIDRVITTKAPIRSEIPFTGTNGTRVYDYIFAPVIGPGGDVVAVAGVTRDITERQSAEQSIREQAQRLAESDRAKDEFLATLSHELRNPLAPLRNSLELLRRSGSREDDLQAVHAMMERQVSHLVRLVDDLLEVSRISRGTFSLRMEQVELASVVRNALETSDPLIQAAGHRLKLQLPDERLALEGDPVRLAQILANLLNNAAKYTEDGGQISVRAWREGDQAVISVADDGVGIPAEILPRMFEMFSRGDRDSGRSQGGLGIGLSLSRRLAEMHGGSLDARSDGPGKGSEFTVRLPLAESTAETHVAVARETPALPSMRVLVVDDNVDAGDSMAMVLMMLGAQTRVVRSGADALDCFETYRPEVVLLDIGMPGMNGYEVAKTIRAQFADTPSTLVALTGWGQDEDRRRAREAGFDHHIVKPAEIDALQALLESIRIQPGAGAANA